MEVQTVKVEQCKKIASAIPSKVEQWKKIVSAIKSKVEQWKKIVSAITSKAEQWKKIARAITSALPVLLAILLAIVGTLGLVLGLVLYSSSPSSSDAMKPIKLICRPTHYPRRCEDALFQSAPANSTSDPKLLLQTLFQLTSDQLAEAHQRLKFLHHTAIDPITKSALSKCTSLIHRATNDLNTSIDQLSHLLDITRIHLITHDLKIHFSKVLDYQESCIDGLWNTTGNAAVRMRKSLTASLQLSSNNLDIVNNISEENHSFGLP